MNVDTIITNARFVLACDDDATTFEHAGIAILDGVIVAIGDVSGYTGEHVIDARKASCFPVS